MQLVFVIHNHQPVGNFGHVFERAYNDAYLPFFELLEQAPHVRVGLHLSGPLLDFFEQAHPDFLDRVGKLVDEGRVEPVGGGLYEPVLTVVPHRDAVGQVDAMSSRLERLFGKRPRGMWLAERVWEPDIPAILDGTGIEYTLVDDGLFAYSGIPPADCEGYWVTESRGMRLNIFPISMKLRYYLPFKPVPMVLEMFKEVNETNPDTVMTFGDDGEKFGIWPETNAWVYGKKWLDGFFQMLADENSWIQTVQPSEYIDSTHPKGRVYLPQASYEEMLEWSLLTGARVRFEAFKKKLRKLELLEEAKPFLRGGTWANFMAKYPEADWMHKRMLRVSNLFPAKVVKNVAQWDEARKKLYQSQCNCAYWHGLFGGIYLNYLRHGVWVNLIAAERLALKLKRVPKLSITRLDINLDGVDEHLLENDDMFAAVVPTEGASVAEIDLRRWDFNLTNVIARREESFHESLREKADDHGSDEGIKTIHELTKAKVAGLEDLLQFDPEPRYSFQDSIPWAILGDAAEGDACKLIEWSGSMPWEWRAIDDAAFEGDIKLKTDEGWLVLHIKKLFNLDGSTLTCSYEIETAWPGQFGFATRFNLSLLAGHADDRFLAINNIKLEPPFMDSLHCLPGADSIELHDGWQKFTVSIEGSPEIECLDIAPIITVSSSEEGLESTYQGTCFTFLRRISRPGRGPVKFAYKITAREMK